MGSTLAANGGEAGLSVLLGTGAREREASRGERGEGERALGIPLVRGEGWGTWDNAKQEVVSTRARPARSCFGRRGLKMTGKLLVG